MATRKQEKAAPQAGEALQTNDTAPAQGEEQGAGLPELTVRIFPARNINSKLKATANVNIAGAFAVRGFRIFDSKNGLFVKEPEQSYVKEGTELTRPVFFPVTKEAREALYGQILRSYELTVHQGQRQEDDEFTLGDEDVPPAPEEYSPEDDLPFNMGPMM